MVTRERGGCGRGTLILTPLAKYDNLSLSLEVGPAKLSGQET